MRRYTPNPGKTWWVGPYRDHLVGLGLADKTVTVYEGKVRQALQWCESQGLNLDQLAASELRQLAASFPQTHTTLRQLRAGLSHYYTLVGREAPLGAIRVPKKPNYRNRALSPAEARLLAKTARYRIPEGLAVSFGLYMALRVSEIATVRWDRFDDRHEWYSVYGKGDETYMLPVHPVLKDDLRYVPRTGPYVFDGLGSRPHVAAGTVWKWVQQVCEAAGIDRVGAHVLRHTAITTANDATGDLRAVSAFARHKRLETTRLYTRTTDKQLLRVVNAIDYESDMDD